MRNKSRTKYRPAYHVRASQSRSARATQKFVARLQPGMRFWSRPPNPARLLCIMVRQILKFHESEPTLSSQPIKNHW
jgi:hypothetical protein